MKKFIFLLVFLISSCQLSDVKFSQDFGNETIETTTEVYSTKKLPSNQIITPVPAIKQDNLPNDIKLNEAEQKYLKPQIGRNLEDNNLYIPPASHRKIQVALFLPFTGKNKDLGWSIFNSASLSLFENDTNNKIELVLFDSKDSIEDNQKVFKEIISRNIKVVIGPIFTNNVLAIEKLARDNEITVISLSNNHDLLNKTNNYGGVFIGGVLPETQIDRIVNYSMDQGKFNFAVIAPNNQYGKVVTEYLKKFVRSRDGNFITSEFYEANSRDIDRAVERVVTSFDVPTSSKNRDTSYLNDYDRIYPQAIFVPEAGKNLSKVVSSIIKLNKDERNFQIIGSSQWDDATTLNDVNLLGSWFPAPEEDRFRIFEKNYYRSFGKFPPRITSIAYDAVLAVAKIAQNKTNFKITLADFIEFTEGSKNGFYGIDGAFRFLPNGAVQRNLAVLQVGNGKFETLENSSLQFLKY